MFASVLLGSSPFLMVVYLDDNGIVYYRKFDHFAPANILRIFPNFLFLMLYRISILFCSSLCIGCGHSRPYDIRAIVFLDSKPFAAAEVSFVSIKNGGKNAFGITDSDGRVSFKTDGVEGVLPGTYTVTISKTVEERRLSNNEIRALAEYGIRYEVKMIELSPAKYTRRETSDLKAKIGYWSSKELTFDLRSDKSPP